MSKIVNFWVMRHGEKSTEKDANELTPHGFAQVAASAKAYLTGIKALAFMHSGQYRAYQTISVIQLVRAADQKKRVLVQDWPEHGFNFSHITAKKNENGQPEYEEFADAQKRVKARVETGELETVAMWLKEWDAAPAIRESIMNCLLNLAGRYGSENEEVHIIAGSHAPTAELATPTPETTTRLNEADIVHYIVVVDDDGKVAIKSCEVLSCPLK